MTEGEKIAAWLESLGFMPRETSIVSAKLIIAAKIDAALSAERERAKGVVELLKAWVCMYEDKNEVPGEARVMAWAASIQALAAYEQKENVK